MTYGGIWCGWVGEGGRFGTGRKVLEGEAIAGYGCALPGDGHSKRQKAMPHMSALHDGGEADANSHADHPPWCPPR